MRIVFLGTSDFGLPTLRALVEGGQDIALVITQPDRPAGRGRRLRAGPIKRYALDKDLPLAQPDDVNAPAVLGRLRRLAPDLLLCIAYGEKLRPALLELAPHGAINLHGSLLPKYRGAAPVNHAIVNGETETGLSVIEMAAEIDAGDILSQRATAIGPDETAGRLHDRLARLGARVVTEVVRELALDEVGRRHQNPTQATYAPKLKKTDGLVRWERPTEAVYNQIRGLTPWPGAYTYLPGGRRKGDLRLVIEEARRGSVRGPAGHVTAIGPEGLEVATADGAVRLITVCPSGKRSMAAADLVNGYAVEVGTPLLVPEKSPVA